MGAYDRRSVLLGGVGLASAGIALDGCTKSPSDKPPPPSDDAAPATEMSAAEVLPVLVAVADVLLPADELGPGVTAAGAEVYFAGILADARLKTIKSVVTRGAVWINRAARKEHNQPFFKLDAKDRDALMQRLAANKVRPNGFSPTAFVRIMLALTLEAFLGDPKHGGNKDGVGWNFIGGVAWAGRKELPVIELPAKNPEIEKRLANQAPDDAGTTDGGAK
jgi:gluconate 2-dehydrogenase gamma chain